MKRLFYTIVVTIVLVSAGAVAVSFAQSRSGMAPEQEGVMSGGVPTMLADFPDIEYVPVYEHATVTFTNTESAKPSYVSFEVNEPFDKVTKFYEEMLLKQGWVFRISRGGRDLYSRADSEGNTPRQLYLELVIGPALDTSRTIVNIEYGRYPNVEGGLPLYRGAQQVTTSHSNVEKNFPSGKTAVRVTDVSYLSNAHPQEIAAFYAESLSDYGWLKQGTGWSTHQYSWFPFDDPGNWEGADLQEGLYFVALRPSWDEKNDGTSAHLLATTSLQGDGQVLVTLHVEEYEIVRPPH